MMTASAMDRVSSPQIDVSLYDIVRPLLRHWKRILLAVFVMASFGLFISFFMTPMHKATASLRIEPEITTSGEESSLTDEVDIIATRAMMAAAISKLGYAADIYVVEKPFFGRLEAIAQELGEKIGLPPRPTFTNANDIAPWLDIETLFVSSAYINKPIIVTFVEDGFYTVTNKKGDMIADGVIGLEQSTASDKNDFYMVLRAANAPNGTQFKVIPRAMQPFVDKQLRHLSVHHRPSRTAIRKGVVTLTLNHQHPFYAEKILGALVSSFLDKVVERSAAGANQKEQLLRAAITDLDQKIIDANLELAELRTNYGIFDIDAEMNAVQEGLLLWQDKKMVLEGEIAVLQPFYGKAHPNILQLGQQLDEAKQMLAKFNESILRLAMVEPYYRNIMSRLEYLRLLQTRAIEQFSALMPNTQNITGYARIINPAQGEAQSLLKWLQPFILIAAVIGGIGYALYIMLMTMLGIARLDTAEDLAEASPLPVYSVVPSATATLSPAVLTKPKDPAFLALQSMAKKWPYMTFNTKTKTVVITGLAAQQGATAMATLLAALNVMEGRRTILINTEILSPTNVEPPVAASRAGILRRFTNSMGVTTAHAQAQAALGFSDVLVGRCTLVQAIVRYGSDKSQFDYVPAGTLVNNHRLLLGNPALASLLKTIDSQYDCAILNMPALSEQLTLDDLAGAAGTVMVVGRVGLPIHVVQSRLQYQRTAAEQQPATFLIINEG